MWRIGTTMGYSPIFSRCSSTNATRTDILNFVARSDARAFYFSGHGGFNSSGSAIIQVKDSADNPVWTMTVRDFARYHTNWNFVFLDACSIGTSSVASAFNIYDSSDSKVFMGFGKTINSNTNAKFNSIFWSQVVCIRLYNCGLVARNAIYDMKLDAPLFFAGDRKFMGGVLGKDPNV